MMMDAKETEVGVRNVRDAVLDEFASLTPTSAKDTDADDAGVRLWAAQWWPLCFAAHTTRAAPVATKLLGAPLVLWWDSVGEAWHCTIDRCSHRLAPLSEGRLSDGCLECPYHGWTFDGEGSCKRIPQLREDQKINQRRASVLALPCQERQGLIWVWGGALFDGIESTPPEGDPGPVLVEPIERAGVEHSDYSRDLHMDWSTLCENVMGETRPHDIRARAVDATKVLKFGAALPGGCRS